MNAFLARFLATHKQETCAEEAELHAREAIRLAPDIDCPDIEAVHFYLNLGTVLELIRDHDGSRAALQDALRCDPEYAPAHFHFGVHACKHKRERRREPEHDPTQQHTEGSTYFHDYASAEHHLREAARCDLERYSPSTHWVWNVHLGNALCHLGQVEDAEHHLREALRISPDEEQCQESLCRFMYHNKGGPAAAAGAITSSERYVKLASLSQAGELEDAEAHPIWKAHMLMCAMRGHLRC